MGVGGLQIVWVWDDESWCLTDVDGLYGCQMMKAGVLNDVAGLYGCL